jgi:hypothetical protein
MRCLIRDIAHLRTRWQKVQSNGWMMSSRGKPNRKKTRRYICSNFSSSTTNPTRSRRIWGSHSWSIFCNITPCSCKSQQTFQRNLSPPESESEWELLYDWRFTTNQAPWDSWPAFFSTEYLLWPYVTSSMTRGWIRSLQLLLALTSTVILRSDSRGTRDHILLSQIRGSSVASIRNVVWLSKDYTAFHPRWQNSPYIVVRDWTRASAVETPASIWTTYAIASYNIRR